MDKGIAEYVGWGGTAGLMIELAHDWGRTRYLHLEATSVHYGDFIDRGQKIGLSGESGKFPDGTPSVDGPHLHADCYPDTEPQDNGYGGRINFLPYLVDRSVRRPDVDGQPTDQA